MALGGLALLPFLPRTKPEENNGLFVASRTQNKVFDISFNSSDWNAMFDSGQKTIYYLNGKEVHRVIKFDNERAITASEKIINLDELKSTMERLYNA